MYVLLVKAQLCRYGKDEGLQGLGWVAMNRLEHRRFFSGSETTLYTIITDSEVTHLSKPIECTMRSGLWSETLDSGR